MFQGDQSKIKLQKKREFHSIILHKIKIKILITILIDIAATLTIKLQEIKLDQKINMRQT